MSHDPCGMAVDLGRYTYSQDCQFSSDPSAPLTRVEWYFCKPEAKTLPFACGIRSLSWERAPWELDGGLGEQYPGRRRIHHIPTPPSAFGQNPCGDATDFANGCAYDPSSTYPRDLFGLLSACNPGMVWTVATCDGDSYLYATGDSCDTAGDFTADGDSSCNFKSSVVSIAHYVCDGTSSSTWGRIAGRLSSYVCDGDSTSHWQYGWQYTIDGSSACNFGGIVPQYTATTCDGEAFFTPVCTAGKPATATMSGEAFVSFAGEVPGFAAFVCDGDSSANFPASPRQYAAFVCDGEADATFYPAGIGPENTVCFACQAPNITWTTWLLIISDCSGDFAVFNGEWLLTYTVDCTWLLQQGTLTLSAEFLFEPGFPLEINFLDSSSGAGATYFNTTPTCVVANAAYLDTYSGSGTPTAIVYIAGYD